MILLVIALLAICGMLTTIGLAIFQLMVLFSKQNKLYNFIFASVFFAIVILTVGSQIPHSSALQLEKRFIFFSIILNHVLAVLFLIKINKNSTYYFPTHDRKLRQLNKLSMGFFIASFIIYLVFAYGTGLNIGWEVITS
jgi:hypothetical protein